MDKGLADPFDLAANLGYYVLVLLITSVLFLFIAVIMNGNSVEYYKSNYGMDALNLQEQVFDCLAYIDPVTDVSYSRVIDASKVTNTALDSCLGIISERDYRGVKINIFADNKTTEMVFAQSSNYAPYPEIVQELPVVIYTNGGFATGIAVLSIWKL